MEKEVSKIKAWLYSFGMEPGQERKKARLQDKIYNSLCNSN